MKGFKKDGKFRPTDKKKKSPLKKSDVRRKRNDIFSGSSSTGLPVPQQVMPKEEKPKNEFENKAKESKVVEDFIKQQKEKPKQEEKGESTAFKLGKLAGKISKAEKEAQKKREQEQIAEQRTKLLIDQAIDKILGDRKSSPNEKFRLLRRFGLENEKSLTPLQLDEINTSLRILESEANSPQTFISETQKSNSGSKDKSKKKEKEKTNETTVEKKPTFFTSEGQPSRIRNPSNLDSTGFSGLNPQTTTTTTTTSTSSPDNQGAELNAILGR